MSDILDIRFVDKEVELKDNRSRIGDDVNITAQDPTLKKLHVGVGWDLNNFNSDSLDLDISLFMLDKNDRTRIDEDFVFYNQKETLQGAVKHNGDSRTGAGDGDDESIAIDLTGVPFDIQKLVFVLSIYRGEEKDQRLGQVEGAFLRLVNADSKIELTRYEITPDLKDKSETVMIVASLNREGPKWHFTPIGEFLEGGLATVATRYGCVIVQQ